MLLFGFLANSLFFLLRSGTWYLVSSLARVFTILLMKALSFLSTTVLVCFLSQVIDIRSGIVLDSEAGPGSKLGNGVEALIDTTSEVEASG